MSYAAWRVTFQSGEQAARSAYDFTLTQKKRIDELEEQLAQLAQDEPVGYLATNLQSGSLELFWNKHEWPEREMWHYLPLYITPQFRELTDEEMMRLLGALGRDYNEDSEMSFSEVIDFARAIIEKARSK